MAIVLKPENVARLVFFIRGEKVMLDVDLAKLYGVTTKALNQAMRRNKRRFPEDFAFRLSRKEFDSMRSQIVTTSRDRPGIWSQIVTFPEVPSFRFPASRIHRTGRRDAFQRTAQLPRR
jgi:hypothetical protein